MATATKSFCTVLIALACLPAWGQAGKTTNPNTPQVFDAPRVTTAAADSAQPVDPKSYLIGPEDVLKVEVYQNAELSRLVNVRPDGKITLLLVGDVQAEGLTPERLTVAVKEAYARYINTPEVTISVMAVNSKSIMVTGKVNRTGKWPLVMPLRVSDAISLAGGLQDWADDKKIVIMRGNDRLYFNYKDFVKGKKDAVNQNVLLQNGDTVYVK